MALKQQYKEELQKSFKEELQMELRSRINKRGGLCGDCVRAESCSLSHNSDAAIWNCEDYDNEEITTVSAESRADDSVKMEAQADPASEINQGLCPYCMHNENCSLKNLEGGIWHCEEYA